jgi:2-hydroxychromene-2-carboxylate isomerase
MEKGSPMPRLEFWYEFASTYSYLSAMRIERLAKDRAIQIKWKPFLLGPIFKAQGWNNSPFNLYPNKGRYMVRDLERICTARGLSFRLSSNFPQNGLYAARLAMIGADEGWGPVFTQEIYLAQFRDGADISKILVLAKALSAAGQNSKAMLMRLKEKAIKHALKGQTSKAAALGIFGAPTFVTEDGELFWGDDRLEQAFDWAASRKTETRRSV